MAASLLVAGGSTPAQADPQPGFQAAPAAPKAMEFSRPEDPDATLRAAIEEARKQNKPVEVEAAYTEGSRTWAYPNGQLTTQSYAGPAQLKQADGSWAWIDTTLVEHDGVLKPKLTKAKIEFSAGGADRPFASMERGDGQKVSFGWPTELPKPIVKGNVATFVNAAGQGADLVVTALPTGFRHDVMLREQPKGPVEFRIPVETDGLDFAEAKRGGLELTDSKGRQVASAAEPVTIDAGPSAADTKKAGAVPPRTGKIDTRVVEEKGKQVLVLTPDPAFLADPATRYPVTVDPTTTLTLQSDLVVSNAPNADTSPASPRLVTSIERTTSGGALTYSHSLLKFDTGVLAGRSVGSARLDMYADQLVGCRWYGPAGIEAKRVTSAWPQYVNWSNQPSVTSFGSSVQLCPSEPSIDDNGNWIPRTFTWSVTAMAQAWAAGQPNEGIRLSGKGTTDPSQNTGWWVYFHSAETAGGTRPKLTVSYFLPPEIPTVTAESIDSMNGNDAIARSQSVKVGFKSSVPEGTNLNYTVTVNDSTMAPPPSFPTGHVAHWKLDEPSGATAAADSGTGGYTATYTGGRRTATTGKLGGGVQLNDMTGSNGCCLPDSYAATNRPVLNQNSSFSISTWVRLKNSEDVQHVASQDGNPFGMSLYYLGDSHQKWRLQISGTGGTTGYGVWVDSAKLAAADTWTHLVGIYDAGASKIRIYVDGVLSGEADYQPAETVTGGPFRIGGYRSGFQFLQGSVDDMRLYQRALSLADIKKLYGEVAATSYNAKPSGQVIEQTFTLDNPASLKFVVRACRSGVTQPSCNESPAYRITSDAPFVPSDPQTGLWGTEHTPILSGMLSRPSEGPVTAKYFLYDNTGAPVGSVPLGERTVNGGKRASFQLPENTVQPGRSYTWQMQACVEEICTSKTPSIGFTVPGDEIQPVEDIRNVTLLKDNFVIKTVKVDPFACDGAPCSPADADRIQVGGGGADKIATIIGLKLDEIPDGATFTGTVLELGTPACPGGVCPPETIITAAPLKGEVRSDSKGPDLVDDIDTSTSFSLSITAPRADVTDSVHAWLMLTSNREEVVTFGDPSAVKQLSVSLSYVPAKPPSNVLNLVAQPGDNGVTASWGMPVDNGALVLLDGYDVQVSDANGEVVKDFKAVDPTVAFSGVTNGVTYTVRVRARTHFGVSGWEETTVTPKAVPPPPPPTGSNCGFGRGGARATSSQSTSNVGEYTERIKSYYRAQDAVLEGRARTVWQAPEISAQAPVTAKLSLLNPFLVQEREAMEEAGFTRANSTVRLENVVPQEVADGTVRVTATVLRDWDEISPDAPSGALATTASGTDVPGQVEPDESTISIFVFDRCGQLSIIDVPLPAEQDSTDSSDSSSCTQGGASQGSARNQAVQSCAGGVPGATNAEFCKASQLHLKCGVKDYLGKKGWYVRTVIESNWPRSSKEGSVNWNQRWFVSNYSNYMYMWPTNKKWSWSTEFGKKLAKDVKMKLAGSACFVNKKMKNTVNVGVSVSPAPTGPPSGSGSFGLGVASEAGEVCPSYNVGGPDKEGDPTTINDRHSPVESECLAAFLDSCDISRYKHTVISEYSFSFTAKVGVDKNKKAIEQKFTTTPIRHTIWCKVERSDEGNAFTDPIWYGPLPCVNRSTLGGAKPLS
ncbi:LamG-like jellyroll fold domain-containing protein [Streptosporangium sp. NPDC023615]|uniref:LamG-like jellyroll fold domain-containing protein n=1 Tax=Streptosporangium sp. NPDC023615 TaxID=3154794 RepID=UPI00342C24B4